MKDRILLLLEGGLLAIGALLLIAAVALPPQQVVIQPAVERHHVIRQNVCVPQIPYIRAVPPHRQFEI